MIQVFKLLTKFKPNPCPNRRHGFQIIWNKPTDGTRGLQANYFYFRTAAIWNNLPEKVVNAININTFKSRLDKALIKHPTKFTIEIQRESDS